MEATHRKPKKTKVKAEAKEEEASKEIKLKTEEKAVHHHHHVKKTKKAEVPKLPENVFYGTGRRKTAIAKVFITPGSGKREVNNKDAKIYFCNRPVLLSTLESPFRAVEAPPMDLSASVYGGGVPAQADAIRMGLSRALSIYNHSFRKTLRSLDLLKRDPREKERKKAGLKRARKAFQYTKR